MKTKKAHDVVRIPTVPAVARTILVSGTAAQTLYEAGRCRLGRGKLLTLLTTGLLLLVVAGCGGGSGTTPPPTPTPTPTPNPSPAITTLSPASAAAGGAAFTLTVDGSNFVPASVVQWNGNSRTTTFVSASQLTAQILAGDIARALQPLRLQRSGEERGDPGHRDSHRTIPAELRRSRDLVPDDVDFG